MPKVANKPKEAGIVIHTTQEGYAKVVYCLQIVMPSRKLVVQKHIYPLDNWEQPLNHIQDRGVDLYFAAKYYTPQIAFWLLNKLHTLFDHMD